MAESKILIQGRDFYSKLKLWQKALFIGIPSFFLLGFILLLAFGEPNNSKYKVLYSDLAPEDASKIIEKLKTEKIDYKLEEEGTKILIAEEEVYQKRIELAADGLPASSTVGYELFDQTNLGMSEYVQKLNFRRALEGELAKTITALEEVKKARVHLVIPKTELFEKDQKVPTAAITLFLERNQTIKKTSVEGIQVLVASSVEGMKPEQVSVVDSKGKLLSDTPLDENSVAGITAVQLEQQSSYEKELEQKVQGMLDGVIGSDNSQVTVTADLDFTRQSSRQVQFNPEEQVARSEQTIAEDSKTADSLSYPNFSQDKTSSNQIANYEISNTTNDIQNEIGNVSRLSVAVMINQKEVMMTDANGIKKPEYQPRPDSVINKIEEIVKNAVGFNINRGDQISVLQVPFETLMDYDLEELNPAPWYQQPYYQKLLALLAAMLITILIMYSILQSQIVKKRIRLAMELPEKVKLLPEDLDDEEEEYEEELDEDYYDEDLLMLPDEMPETLLLEQNINEFSDVDLFEDDNIDLEKDSESKVESMSEEMTEHQIMNLEMKQQVEEFCRGNIDDAVKIIRIFMNSDADMQRLSL